MLQTLTEILKIAEDRQIAVGSFNTPDSEYVEAVIETAEELKLPVIVQFAEGQESWTPISVMGPLMISMAKNAKVPVCVHLDHGETLSYLEQALEMGFTGIMYDGSTLPYEENVINTRKAVAMAAKYGAGVEAELGSMGVRESGEGCGSGNGDPTKIYTDPLKAKKFVEETGVNALACSFGTTHGIYLTEPHLDFHVVEEVRKQTGGLPVVMHGGSGVSTEDFHKAVHAGVRKINYFTYLDLAAGSAVEKYMKTSHDRVQYYKVIDAARAAMKDNVREAMRTFALLDE